MILVKRVGPSAERVRQLIHYDPETGVFTRRTTARRWKAGMIVGIGYPDFYAAIYLDGVRILAHRVAWVYMTGEWPVDQIEHIDCDKSNTRWSNLRQSTQSENVRNCHVRRHNRSRLKGVGFRSDRAHRRKRWNSSVVLNGKKYHLGVFDCPAAAHFAYIVAADQLHGEFARFA